MRKFAIPSILTVIVAAPLMIYFWRTDLTPMLAGREGVTVDALLRLEFSIAAFFFALCIVFLLYAMVAFRRQAGDDGDGAHFHSHTTLEIVWTAIPLVIVIALGFVGIRGLRDVSASPTEQAAALDVTATGFQWAWEFEYPESGVTSSELVLPVDRPVRFKLIATDVIHSFWVPEWRLKEDTIPGVENELYLTPTETGEYKVRCAELCGTGHSSMLATVKVVDSADYDAWIDEQLASVIDLSEAGARGLALSEANACIACHSPDGSVRAGPTWQGIFGSEEKLDGGSTQVVDEDYIRESILDPGKVIVDGYTDVMPKTFADTLSDEDIDDIIQYIKELQ